MFAHVVDANVHQFYGIERTAPQMWAAGGVRRAAFKVKIQLVAGQRIRAVNTGKGGRVPADCNIHIVKHPLFDHKAFRGAALFRWATVKAHGAG